MAIEIKVPSLGESITEATVGAWFKKVGDEVAADEPLVELETEKVTLEVPAPAAGVIEAIAAEDGATVEVGAVLGSIKSNGAAAKPKSGEAPAKAKSENGEGATPTGKPDQKTETARPIASGPEEMKAREPEKAAKKEEEEKEKTRKSAEVPSPAARKILEEGEVGPSDVEGSGKDGRITKADAMAAVEGRGSEAKEAKEGRPTRARAPSSPEDASREERVPMTRLRQTIARRLKEAQNTAAMLTTFNEVDMSAVMAMRTEYRDLFQKKHAVKLGFMGFFIKACVQALKEIPAVNGEIDGTDMVYKNYYNIGIAVGTDKGLVVPVLQDADAMSLADIEKALADLGTRARDGRLKLEEFQGGTFTISNGGIYGSLMSTPILNAPQSGILGMHKIQERPMAVGGEVKVRPMMYVALSYDHRIVDGKEAVTFLVRVKECIEDPQRLVLDL